MSDDPISGPWNSIQDEPMPTTGEYFMVRCAEGQPAVVSILPSRDGPVIVHQDGSTAPYVGATHWASLHASINGLTRLSEGSSDDFQRRNSPRS